jgi:hypothetical protein
MKIKETQFVQLPLLGIANNLEIIVNPFPLYPTSIEVQWRVSGELINKEGIIVLPYNVITSWGTDDTVVKDYVLQQLGLVEELPVDPIILQQIGLVEELPVDPSIETPIIE